MKSLSYRFICFIGFSLIAVLLMLAFSIEEYYSINPCPLCILQRVDLVFLGIIFLFGASLNLNKAGQIFIGIFVSIISLSGIALALRQVWLQHLPPNSSSDCGASLQYLMKILPFDQVVRKVLEGSAECSQTTWEFLHISMAGWSLIWFVIFFLFGVYLLTKKIKPKVNAAY